MPKCGKSEEEPKLMWEMESMAEEVAKLDWNALVDRFSVFKRANLQSEGDIYLSNCCNGQS